MREKAREEKALAGEMDNFGGDIDWFHTDPAHHPLNPEYDGPVGDFKYDPSVAATWIALVSESGKPGTPTTKEFFNSPKTLVPHASTYPLAWGLEKDFQGTLHPKEGERIIRLSEKEVLSGLNKQSLFRSGIKKIVNYWMGPIGIFIGVESFGSSDIKSLELQEFLAPVKP